MALTQTETFQRQDLADVLDYIDGRRATTANQQLSMQTIINSTLQHDHGSANALPCRRGIVDGRFCPDQDIPLAFCMPVAGFSIAAFEGALCDVLRATEVLRAEFNLATPSYYQIRPADAPADIRRARAADARAATQLLEAEFLRGFPVEIRRPTGHDGAVSLDSTHLPRVVRALIVEGPSTVHVLIVIHHLVFDGVSCGPFLVALGEAYQARRSKAECPVSKMGLDGNISVDLSFAKHGDEGRGGAPPAYADFAAWQASFLRDTELEPLLETWARLLRVEERDGELPLLQLPALQEHPLRRPSWRPDPRRSRCDPSATFAVAAPRVAALHRQHGGTTETQLLLGLYAVCLMRIARQDAVVVGMPFEARPAGFEQSIGYFANPLPILIEDRGRAGTAPGEAGRFHHVLAQIDVQVRAALEGCGQVPFQELVRRHRSRTPAAQRRTPIMQALFLYENFCNWDTLARSFGLPRGSLQGVHFSEHRFAQLDVQLAVSREYELDPGSRKSQQLHFHLSSNSLGQRDVEDLAAVLEQLISSCCSTKEQVCPFQAKLVPCAQERDLLFTFQNQDEAFNTSVCKRIGQNETVVHMIRHAVDAYPENEAVCFQGRRMTYRQLWRASMDVGQRVRARLEQLRCKEFRSDVVGMAVERSAEQVVIVLGIMLAGCAYLPFYHNEPVERIQGVIQRHRIGVVVAVDRRFEDYHGDGELFPGDLIGKEELLLLPGYKRDEKWFIVPGVDTADDAMQLTKLRSQGLCYCLKTSGTTGEPKLVPVQHSAVTNRLLWMQREFPLNEKDRFLRKAPIDFDVSVWEMLWPLVVGACVVVDAASKGMDFRELRRLIKRQRVTCLHFVPTLFDAFLGKSKQAQAQLDSVRGIFCSGEALKWDTVRRCRLQMRNAECVKNWYGPTEGGEVTSMECLTATGSLEMNAFDGEVYVPMGKPISNTRIVLLDENQNLVPIGTPGEVYIVGECLAAGYLNNPEQTCQRFVELEGLGLLGSGTACIADKGIVRAYRTGDLAIVLADGNVLYLGRIDKQVKLRGVRVELGGIEAMAMGAPLGDGAHMEHAACIIHNDQIALFYVVSTNRPRDGHYTEVEKFLKRKLPSAQQPHWICEMEEIPVTKTGKLDTKQLVERIAQAEAQSDAQAEALSGNLISEMQPVTPRKVAPHESKIRRVLAKELRVRENKVNFDQNVRWMLDSMGMTRIAGHLQFVSVIELMDMEEISMRALVELFEKRRSAAVTAQAVGEGSKRIWQSSFDSPQYSLTPKKTRLSLSTSPPTKLSFTPSTVNTTPSSTSPELSGLCDGMESKGSKDSWLEGQPPKMDGSVDKDYTAVPTTVLNKMVACCREFEKILKEKDELMSTLDSDKIKPRSFDFMEEKSD